MPSLRWALVGLVAALANPASGSAGQAPLKDDFVCQHPPYRVHMVSKSPLVIYITDFLTPDERVHLQAATYVTESRSDAASRPFCVRRCRLLPTYLPTWLTLPGLVQET